MTATEEEVTTSSTGNVDGERTPSPAELRYERAVDNAMRAARSMGYELELDQVMRNVFSHATNRTIRLAVAEVARRRQASALLVDTNAATNLTEEQNRGICELHFVQGWAISEIMTTFNMSHRHVKEIIDLYGDEYVPDEKRFVQAGNLVPLSSLFHTAAVSPAGVRGRAYRMEREGKIMLERRGFRIYIPEKDVPVLMAQTGNAKPPVEYRLWRDIELSSDGKHWLWVGPTDQKEYPIVYNYKSNQESPTNNARPARLIWEMAGLPHLEGRQLIGACPNRTCVNPACHYISTGWRWSFKTGTRIRNVPITCPDETAQAVWDAYHNEGGKVVANQS